MTIRLSSKEEKTEATTTTTTTIPDNFNYNDRDNDNDNDHDNGKNNDKKKNNDSREETLSLLLSSGKQQTKRQQQKYFINRISNIHNNNNNNNNNDNSKNEQQQQVVRRMKCILIVSLLLAFMNISLPRQTTILHWLPAQLHEFFSSLQEEYKIETTTTQQQQQYKSLEVTANEHTFNKSTNNTATSTSTSSTSSTTFTIYEKGFANNCFHIFLDVGSNLGVHGRFLFEPHLYPKALIAQSIFRKQFGMNYDNRDICVISIEPNPNHRKRQVQLQQYYYSKFSWRYIPIQAGVVAGDVENDAGDGSSSSSSSSLIFYHGNDQEFEEWGFNSKKMSDNDIPVHVPTIRLSDFLIEEIYNRTLPKVVHYTSNNKSSRRRSTPKRIRSLGGDNSSSTVTTDATTTNNNILIPPQVVMKLDIEGMEYDVFPDLIMTGALCAIVNYAFGEFHGRLQPQFFPRNATMIQTPTAIAALEKLQQQQQQQQKQQMMMNNSSVVVVDDYFGITDSSSTDSTSTVVDRRMKNKPTKTILLRNAEAGEAYARIIMQELQRLQNEKEEEQQQQGRCLTRFDHLDDETYLHDGQPFETIQQGS